MEKDWLILVQKYDLAGARSKFESICLNIFKKKCPQKYVNDIRCNPGDEGIDIFIGSIGNEPIEVIQCKFFFPHFGNVQKKQIRESFKTAINSKEYKVKKWTLCIINKLDIHEQKWWTGWKSRTERIHGKKNNFITLKDGQELIKLLKENDLYNHAFEIEDSLKINDIHQKIVGQQLNLDIEKTLRKSSNAVDQIVNYIGEKRIHIEREETYKIYNWINNDLKKDTKNVLILTGEKGIGKSSVLKDLYNKLQLDSHYILGIKADKFYYNNVDKLEKNLFLNKLTFEKLIDSLSKENKKLIIIIDQIDALSHSITSNRDYINTYNRLISEFLFEENIRVIVSTRSYDLEYDAELSVYNSNEFSKVKVQPFSSETVYSILEKFNINCTSQKLINLLTIPHHLNIFCKLPNKSELVFDTISSLKELYDELWHQYISVRKNPNIKKLLYTIANKMYNEGIDIKNIYEDNYFDELSYLKSVNLLIEQNQRIQFFHQTFYEYCYAKHFVENNLLLEKYIIENDQSIYSRSVIKMVIEYLRENEISKYISTLEEILVKEKYRFHIKSLLINTLASQINPCIQEKSFVLEKVLTDDTLEELFINSLNSKNWISFLIEEDIPLKYLNTNKANFNWSIFSRNINNSPIDILDYTNNLDFPDKDNLIFNLLVNLNNWEDPELLSYFSDYIIYMENNTNQMPNFWYFELLERIYIHHPLFVYEKLETPLKRSFNGLEYELNKSLEEISKNNVVGVLEFLINIFENISEDSKIAFFQFNEILSPLFDSYENAILFNNNDEDGRTIIFHINQLLLKVEVNYFLKFYEKYKNSNNINVLKVLIYALQNRNEKFANESYKLILIIRNKNGFKGKDDIFQLQLRELISLYYSNFNEEQRVEINSLLLNMSSKYDIFIYTDFNGKRKYSLRNFGKKQFAFIKALPKEVLEENKDLKRTYQVLFRKFGDINHKRAIDTGTSEGGFVGPPLSYKAYKKMTVNGWKKSMYKYDENYQSKEFLKGGMEQHSNKFKEVVQENPHKFFDLINSLFLDEKINLSYINSGINGLIEGKYDPEKVKSLFKKFTKINSNRIYTLYSNSQIKYFISTDTIDSEIVEYLSNRATSDTYIEKVKNKQYPLIDSTNSIIGSAIDCLMLLYRYKEYEEIIFNTIEQVLKNKKCNDYIRITIMYQIANLNHLNIDRAFKIFNDLLSSKSIDILKASLTPAHYFNNKFHNKMEEYFLSILNCDEIRKDSYIIVNSYLLKKKFGLKYYKQFAYLNTDTKLCTLKVAEKNLFHKYRHVHETSLSILYEFLNEYEQNIATEYSAIILRKFKPENFDELLDFMKAYSKSVVCRNAPAYFIDHLLNNLKSYPQECLELLENINFNEKSDYQYVFHNKGPVQVVLGIYSKLITKSLKNKSLITRCMNLFDNMLKHPNFRNNANSAIELLSE
ncbi:ATP-binding protein [Chryseobacterium cucumeris]|uniref:ATP-binding protein n=1 Tax=Chryseobacterium cucumeris TaxID=1813611 RepID=UPI0023F2CAD6|nr:ATP-binding protein [Chryseobacterium cucumeris]